ncbi:MAG: ATP-binding protein, partial [Clostridia bacterium]|nr:ATP-binding protein [Clostridia bacterium]
MTAICGLTGTGKTTFATAIAQQIDNDKERRQLAEIEVERLNSVGFKNLKVPDSLFCSDYNAFSKVKVGKKKFAYLPRNFVSGYDLGTPVDYRNNALFCPYSLYISDEYSRYARARNFASFPEFVEYLGQMQRQFNLDIALLFQRKGGVDTILRQLFHRLMIMESITFKFKRNGKIKSSEWVFTEFVSGRGKSAFEWSDNKDLTPMTTEEKQELRKKARKKITDFFPLSIFISSETKVAREQLRFAINERLLNNSCCEVKTYTFKDDISELMDT